MIFGLLKKKCDMIQFAVLNAYDSSEAVCFPRCPLLPTLNLVLCWEIQVPD